MLKKHYFLIELNNDSNGKNGLKIKIRLINFGSKNKKEILRTIKSLKKIKKLIKCKTCLGR